MLDDGDLYQPFRFQSIIARGYWEEHSLPDDELDGYLQKPLRFLQVRRCQSHHGAARRTSPQDRRLWVSATPAQAKPAIDRQPRCWSGISSRRWGRRRRC